MRIQEFIFLALILTFVIPWLFKRHCDNFPLFSFTAVLLYSALSKSLSVAYLDFIPTYITEAKYKSEWSMAWAYFLISNVIIFISISITLKKLAKGGEFKIGNASVWGWSSVQSIAASGMCFLGITLHIVNIAGTGRVALSQNGLSRFEYWNYSIIPLDRIFGVLMLFLPMMAASLAISSGLKGRIWYERMGLFFFISYLMVMIVEGQRLHGLLLGLSIGLACWYLLRRGRRQSILSLKIISIGSFGLILLWLVLVRDFSSRGLSDYTGGPYAAILYRILVLQGHTVWSAFNYYFSHGANWDISGLFTGTDYIMNLTGDGDVVSAYEDRGVNFAMALPGSLIMIMGVIGVIVGCVVYGVLYAIIIYGIGRAIAKGNVFSVGFLTYTWLAIHSIYAQASFEPLLSPIPYIGIVFYYFSEYYCNKVVKNIKYVRT